MEINRYEKILVDIANEIIGFLINHGAKKMDAQDIMQDVFVKLLQADIILTPDKLRPWLYRVALSRFYDIYRRRKRYRDILLETYAQYSEVEPVLTDYSSLQRALEQLNDYQRALIILHYDDRKRINDIAVIYNVSESKIKVDLYRTRKQLKDMMVGYENE
ncbi:RNA polymerase sigma factor [Leuconostoc rapi]|uniref:RNA polymerase sigma factor n=1 Tax=Leuconostoc rapi TaxID=1406906 RepID=UPI001958051A|nr:sigma-70 family RNA polymerase sigma factor [Leuconostoc rapi]MBM7435293.1 RNA polymerase sigma-70 factor (ECF subfamily) [Leuconostoc rapi]